MNQPEFISGVLPEQEDPRDFVAEAIFADKKVLGAYPETLDLRDNLPLVRNQGSRGTCAAFAAATIKEWQEATDSGYRGKMSPEFVYWHRTNKPGSGMYSRDVMKILIEQGCCTEHELKYASSDSKAPITIPQDVLDSAKNNVAEVYAAVNTIDGLKTALYQSGPCYIAFNVYNVRPEFWRKKTPESKVSGGHAVTVVGYNSEGFIIRNSWGTGFGDDGYVIYPYTDFGMHRVIYSIIDVRGSPKPPPAPPTPKNKCCVIC